MSRPRDPAKPHHLRRAPQKVVEPTEKQFMAQVIQMARLFRWLVYHTYDSRRSVPGFPDLVAIRAPRPGSPARLIAAELKSSRGTTTPEQDAWLQAFREVGAEVFIWRPAQWEEIEATLK